MMDVRQQIEQAIALQEGMRGTVEDALIDITIAALRKQLEELPPALEQQRKLVTVLFVDIVESTNMIRDLEPEENLEIVDRGLKRLSVPISKHGGHVTRFTGDGFKAIFGAPLAREDDPEMAIRAGLGVLEVADAYANELQTQWGIADFHVRVGINTGLAALGGLTEAEDTVMGSTVNLAKRIESAAPPGCVLISHNTYRHVRGVFNVKPLDPIFLKGFREAVRVYQVEDAKPRAFWVRPLEIEGIETRMVGRERELKILQAALQDLLESGQGGIITINGEAGVGKTRLLYEFNIWIELLPQFVRFFQGRGRRETQYHPYALLRDLFTSRFQITEHDSLEQVHQKLEEGFGEAFGMDEQGKSKAHLLGQLLGFDYHSSPYLQGIFIIPEQLFERGLSYLVEYLTAISKLDPIVIFLEDLHWADDSSLNTLNQLGQRLSAKPVLMVCVARTSLFERHPDWGSEQPDHTLLDLAPLSVQDCFCLVEEILKKADQLPEDFTDLIVKSAEGNPFYIEEMIKMLIDEGAISVGYPNWQIKPDRLANIHVPPTLTSLLQARVDGLMQTERSVLQQAAVVGRTFWDAALVHINAVLEKGMNTRELSAALSALCEKEILYRQKTSAFRAVQEYNFKHVMLHDVVYESVLKRDRRTYHAAVAEWLVERSGDRLVEYCGQIADHLELAGQYLEAAAYLVKAGDQARTVYALVEAERYYHRAIALQKHHGEDELAARTLMKLGLVHTAAFEPDRARQVYDEAFNLWEPLKESNTFFDIQGGKTQLRIAIDEPGTLDPGYVSDDFSSFFVAQLFDGLVRIGQDYNVLPAVAARWEILDEGTRYIFHLRKGLKWSDGKVLTAADFEFAWKRNLDKVNEIPYAQELYVIKNARAFGEGKSDNPDDVGVRVLDDETLEIILETPSAYLPYLLTQPITYPLPRWAIERYGSGWTEPRNIITNGAYQLAEWEHARRIILIRNPYYRGPFVGNVEQVECIIFPDVESALEAYANTSVDLVSMFNADPDSTVRAHKLFDDELVSIPYPTVLYLSFRADKTPFNDVRVRKAFIHAVDREALSKNAFFGQRMPALGGFVPPGMPAYSPDIGLPFDPELARQLLAQAGFPGGRGFPEVSWLHGRSSKTQLVIDFMQTAWMEILGLELHPQGMDEWGAFLEKATTDPANLTMIGWGADYPDPECMLTSTFHSKEGENIPRWWNERFDALVEEAGRITDQTKRIKLYQEADRILVAEEAVVMPISYREGRLLVKPYVILPGTLSIQLPLKNVILKGGIIENNHP